MRLAVRTLPTLSHTFYLSRVVVGCSNVETADAWVTVGMSLMAVSSSDSAPPELEIL